jgi:hypothetical protein
MLTVSACPLKPTSKENIYEQFIVQKNISLLDLIFIGLGAIFGSAWLFGVSNDVQWQVQLEAFHG